MPCYKLKRICLMYDGQFRIALVCQSSFITSIKAFFGAQSQGKVCNRPADRDGSVRLWWSACPCSKKNTHIWRCSTGAHNDQNKQTQQEVWNDQMTLLWDLCPGNQGSSPVRNKLTVNYYCDLFLNQTKLFWYLYLGSVSRCCMFAIVNFDYWCCYHW